MTDWTSLDYVVVDVEGNGQQPPDLVELAAVPITGGVIGDVDVLTRKLADWDCPEVLDPLKLARRVLPGRDSYRFGALVEAFKLAEGLPEGLTPHRATYDALVTDRMFVRLVNSPDACPLSLEVFRGQPPSGGADDEAPVLF